MGLERKPAIAQPAKDIVDPRTGKPARANDLFFAGLNEELSERASLSLRATISSSGRAPAR
jgi:hypothetical protein